MVKIKSSQETLVYVSDKGYYVIKQDDWEGREQTILLTADQLRLIAKHIKTSLADKSWQCMVEED